jgi:uncharacterized protein YdaU (DUF1376 family)
MAAKESKVDIYMPVFIGDYLRDTADLNAEEHGAYFKLMMALWTSDGALPFEPERLERIAALPHGRWAAVWSTVGRFFVVEGGKLTQKRLLEELGKARAKKKSAVDKAKKGAAGRHGKPAKGHEATPGKLLEATPQAVPGAALEGLLQTCPSPSPSPSGSHKDPLERGEALVTRSTPPPPTSRDEYLPTDPHRMLTCLRAEVQQEHPEIGFYDPGPFAVKEAQDFFDRSIPVEERRNAAPVIQARIEAFVKDHRGREHGWSVKEFIRQFTALGARAAPARSRVKTVAPANWPRAATLGVAKS